MTVPQHIKKLVAAITFSPDKWWLSMTLDTTLSPEKILQLLRSKIPSILADKDLHHDLKYQERALITALYNYIREHTANAKDAGILVLASFNHQEMRRVRKEEIDECLIFFDSPLISKPSNQIILSHAPDLTFAVNHFPTNKRALMLTFEPNLAQLHQVLANQVQQLWSEKGEFIQPDHNRYYEKVSYRGGQSVRHGTGSEKAKRTLESGLQLFVTQCLSKLPKKNTFSSLTVLLSQQLSELKKPVKDHLHQKFANMPILVRVVPTAQMTEQTLLKYSPGKGLAKATEYNIPSPEHPNVLSDPHAVTKALRRGKVEELILDTHFSQKGYVTPEGRSYTYPVKDSKQVDSLRAWLVTSAVNSGANITAVEDIPATTEQVLATTRY